MRIVPRPQEYGENDIRIAPVRENCSSPDLCFPAPTSVSPSRQPVFLSRKPLNIALLSRYPSDTLSLSRQRLDTVYLSRQLVFLSQQLPGIVFLSQRPLNIFSLPGQVVFLSRQRFDVSYCRNIYLGRLSTLSSCPDNISTYFAIETLIRTAS